MHIHILGICGTFMGGIAAIAREAGHRVTGCDANVYPPMSDQLRALGIDLIEGFAPEQLALKPDLFVVGNVVTRGNANGHVVLRGGGELHQLRLERVVGAEVQRRRQRGRGHPQPQRPGPGVDLAP